MSLSLSILFKPHETAKMTERLKRPIYARFCTIFVLSHKLYRNFIVEEGSVLLLTHIYMKDYVWRLYLTLNSKRPPRCKKSRDPKKRFCPRIVCNFYSVLIRRGSLSLWCDNAFLVLHTPISDLMVPCGRVTRSRTGR